MLVNVMRKTKDNREIREYNVNFSRLLFFLIFSTIEKNITPLIVKRKILMNRPIKVMSNLTMTSYNLKIAKTSINEIQLSKM